MDLRVFYQKLKQIESQIVEEHPVVVSYETPDGGKAGMRTEVPRPVAARMVAEGKARLGTEEEAAEFRGAIVLARKAAEQAICKKSWTSRSSSCKPPVKVLSSAKETSSLWTII